MSVSRTVYDTVEYDSKGVVLASGTFCNIYVVDLENQNQWTTGAVFSDGCPDAERLENAFVQVREQ
jgi:hypothetical protein